MKATISRTGHLTLPAEIRQQDQIEPGQEFYVERIGRGVYRLARVAPRSANQGLVDWLLACPEKDFFVPINPESIDSLIGKTGVTVVDPFV